MFWKKNIFYFCFTQRISNQLLTLWQSPRQTEIVKKTFFPFFLFLFRIEWVLFSFCCYQTWLNLILKYIAPFPDIAQETHFKLDDILTICPWTKKRKELNWVDELQSCEMNSKSNCGHIFTSRTMPTYVEKFMRQRGNLVQIIQQRCRILSKAGETMTDVSTGPDEDGGQG